MTTPEDRSFNPRAWLQLMRFPAVFTAPPDVCLGFLLFRNGSERNPATLALLVGASCCLYLAGMVFNDVFDREVDAAERAERPIPSGRVSVAGAVRLGGLLLVCGVALAGLAGRSSLFIAVLLTLTVLLYDGVLKRTPLGPIAMGGCRALNVLLGAAWSEESLSAAVNDAWLAPLGLGVYIAGVTWFARQESRVSNRASLGGAAVLVDLGVIALMLFVWTTEAPADRTNVLFALGLIAVVLNRRLAAALFDPVPGNVQPAVRTLILSVVIIDATLVFHTSANPAYALAVVSLLVPAMFIGRWIYVT